MLDVFVLITGVLVAALLMLGKPLVLDEKLDGWGRLVTAS